MGAHSRLNLLHLFFSCVVYKHVRVYETRGCRRASVLFCFRLHKVTMCCRTLLDPAAREVLKPTLLELCRQSFKKLLDKEKAAQAKQVGYRTRIADFSGEGGGGG